LGDKIILQLGTNRKNRLDNLSIAFDFLGEKINIIQKSGIYETEPWGKTNQDLFLNQLILGETLLNPYELLDFCKTIEKNMGREKKIHWGPRIIDLDIIYYSNKIIFSPNLNIPHREMVNRNFILVPLKELANQWIHPILKVDTKILLNNCTDKSEVKRMTE
jgi:2-amino-4-hydroxy-6-hydroxymethyldihydropteridine diphosphokinase